MLTGDGLEQAMPAVVLPDKSFLTQCLDADGYSGDDA